MTLTNLRERIRDVPDFPKPGIVFKDITPILGSGTEFASLTAHMSQLVPKATTKLAAIESRGFIIGAALAANLGLGLALIRKPGKLPYSTFSHTYDLEYGRDTLQIHVDAFSPDDRVCIVDDVLATGGTASAAETLCLETGAVVTGFAFMIELAGLGGRSRLKSEAKSLLVVP